jgi:predicted nucleotidyltransferase
MLIDDSWIARWSERLRTEIPDVEAILLKGSHARGDAGPHSDIDFDVLVTRSEKTTYAAYIEETVSGRSIHVSIAIHDLATWIADEADPVSWSFGLPAREIFRLLWASSAPSSDTLRDLLGRPSRVHPPSDPQLEDFIECFAKVRNADRDHDELALRLAAQNLAQLCPTLLRLVNPEVVPDTRLAALRAVLAFPVAPARYRDDLLHCLGLADDATSREAIFEASQRLTAGTLALLQAAYLDHHLAGAFEDGLDVALENGTLARHVMQT